MTEILLLNPNTSERTTDMMVDIARGALPPGYIVRGVTAELGAPIILTPDALDAAGYHVIDLWRKYGGAAAGIVISAFGDPGIDALRRETRVPVVGICEASVLEAASSGRRFGIATITPDLVEPIEACVHALGLTHTYTGTRLTTGDPEALAVNPERLEESLAAAVTECIELDHAEAVVIGGGPLGRAAVGLSNHFAIPIIAPIPAAIRKLVTLLGGSRRI
jgi:Asp/Glu/hydantoin racemase